MTVATGVNNLFAYNLGLYLRKPPVLTMHREGKRVSF
jgi:hypothetical protein